MHWIAYGTLGTVLLSRPYTHTEMMKEEVHTPLHIAQQHCLDGEGSDFH